MNRERFEGSGLARDPFRLTPVLPRPALRLRFKGQTHKLTKLTPPSGWDLQPGSG